MAINSKGDPELIKKLEIYLQKFANQLVSDETNETAVENKLYLIGICINDCLEELGWDNDKDESKIDALLERIHSLIDDADDEVVEKRLDKIISRFFDD